MWCTDRSISDVNGSSVDTAEIDTSYRKTRNRYVFKTDPEIKTESIQRVVETKTVVSTTPTLSRKKTNCDHSFTGKLLQLSCCILVRWKLLSGPLEISLSSLFYRTRILLDHGECHERKLHHGTFFTDSVLCYLLPRKLFKHSSHFL